MNFPWPIWIAFALGVSVYLNLMVFYFLCFKKLELLEGMLERSKWIADSKAMYSEGPIGRGFRLNTIVAIVCFPELCHKRGLVEKEDVYQLPRALKRWVILVYAGFAVNLSGAIILINFL